MEEKEWPQNCWDFWDCDSEVAKKCPAYISGAGKECWLVAGSFASETTCPKVAEGMHCSECPWYQKSISMDKKQTKV